MATITVQRMVRASGGQYGTYHEYETVRVVEAESLDEALDGELAGECWLPEGATPERCDDGERWPAESDDADEILYLHVSE